MSFVIAGADVGGQPEVGIDLVREQVAWFGDRGGTPLRVPLQP